MDKPQIHQFSMDPIKRYQELFTYFRKIGQTLSPRLTNNNKYQLIEAFNSLLSIPQFILKEKDGKFTLILEDDSMGEEDKEDKEKDKKDRKETVLPGSINSRFCGKLFRKGDVTFRCKDCSTDLKSTLCQECFNESDHIGHEVGMIVHTTRDNWCSCGDTELWSADLRCLHHHSDCTTHTAELVQISDPPHSDQVEPFISASLDVILSSLGYFTDKLYSDHDEEHVRIDTNNFSKSVFFDEGYNASYEYSLVVWDDDHHTFFEFERLCQAAIKCSEDQARDLRLELDRWGRVVVITSHDLDAILAAARVFTATSFQATVRYSPWVFFEELSILILEYFDILIHSPAIQNYSRGKFLDLILQELALSLANFPLVYPAPIPTFRPDSISTPLLPRFIPDGLHLVTEGNEEGASHHAHPSEEIHPHDAPQSGSDWKGTTEGSAGLETSRPTSPVLFASLESQDHFPGIIPDIELSSEYPFYSKVNPRLQLDREYIDQQPSPLVPKHRLYHMMSFDAFMSKSMRRSLRQLYLCSPIIADYQFCAENLGQFFVNYPNFLKGSFLKRKSNLQGVLGFAIHLLSRPSITEPLVTKYNFICYLIALVERLFLSAGAPSEGQCELLSITTSFPLRYSGVFSYPSPIQVLNLADYKTKHFSLILQNLHYLLEQSCVQALLPRNHLNVCSVLYLLALFQGMNHSSRLAESHIEYESDTYVAAFEASFYMYRIIRPFCTALGLEVIHLAKAIRRVIYKIDFWIHRGGEASNADASGGRYCVEFKAFPDSMSQVKQFVNFQVDSGQPVSLHYTLHWFLSLLLMHTRQLSPNRLREIGFNNIQHLLVGVPQNHPLYFDQLKNLQAIFDFPLRAVVMSCQIRTNLWVRNGQTMRAQNFNYRDMTDSLFQLDLYLVQFMMILFPPDSLLATMIYRFNITPLLTEHLAHPTYDPNQMQDMVSEFFATLIYCLTERGRCAGFSDHSELRREVLHHAIKPISFSDLDRMLPDRLLERCNLSHILAEICDFKPPDQQNATGTYKVKQEFYHEINPYFFISSRNSRDMAEQRKKEANGDDPVYFRPFLDKVDSGPFWLMGDIVHDRYMVSIMLFGLYHAIFTLKSQTLLEDVLMMYLIASEDKNSSVVVKDVATLPGTTMSGIWDHAVNIETDVVFPGDTHPTNITCLELILRAASMQEFEPSRAKLTYVLGLIGKYCGENARSTITTFQASIQRDGATQAKLDLDEKKKLDAKARRDRLRMQFQNDQNTFMKNQAELYNETELVEGELGEEEGNMADPSLADVPYLTGNCLICTEEGSATATYGILAYIQPSKLLSTLTLEDIDLIKTGNLEGKGVNMFNTPLVPTQGQMMDPTNDSSSLPDHPHLSQLPNPDITPQNPPCTDGTQYGFHLSSCGHILHTACLDEFYKQLEQRLNVNPARSHVENLNFREFVCPLCKSIANVILPISGNPGLAHWVHEPEVPRYEAWASQLVEGGMQLIRKYNVLNPIDPIDTLCAGENIMLHPQATRPEGNQQGSPVQVPFHGDLMAGLNEPLSMTGSALSFTALQSRSRSQLISASRTGTLINEFMESLLASASLPNGDPLKNNQLTAFFDISNQGLLSPAHAHRLTPAVIKAYIKLADGFRVGYAQRAMSDSLGSAWREYYPCQSVLDPLIGSLAYTISFVEISFRTLEPDQKDKFIVDHIPTITRDLLIVTWNNIVSMAGAAGKKFENYHIKRNISHLAQIYGLDGPSVLHTDPFQLLVELSLTAVPLLKLDIRNLVLTLVMVHLTKLMVGIYSAGFAYRTPYPTQANHNNQFPAEVLEMMQYIGTSPLQLQPSTMDHLFQIRGLSSSWPFIHQALITFLNKCILFLDSCQAPLVRPINDSNEDEIDVLLKTMSLPPLKVILTEWSSNPILLDWLNKWVTTYRTTPTQSLTIEYPFPYQLHPLPHLYSTLFSKITSIICSTCGNNPNNPGICLLCGIVLCVQADCCRSDLTQEGEATQHRKKCGGEIGVVLVLNASGVVVQHGGNGSYLNAPYLDRHGEYDLELRKGTPLYMHSPRYQFFLKMVLTHTIPQSVGRKLEASFDLGGWPTL